ncbi:MAG: cation diffusion facilitator family transporter [Gammaproteobacteria bacterium]|nr:cation diffusion facilitator family transporter [Gammaproteobacteria bacterium]
MSSGSKKIVVIGIASNAVVTIIKFLSASVSTSASMMNEAIHSLMDTLNQLFLLFGLIASEKAPDQDYAFGHHQKKFIWNLWSAIGLFSIGSGLGLYHAYHSYSVMSEAEVEAVSINILNFNISGILLAFIVLSVSFVIEGNAWRVAMKEFRHRTKDIDISVVQYISEAKDPTLVAMILEDSIAMFGILLAIIGISLSYVTGNPVWDILFSSLIAILLGIAAVFLGRVNMIYLSDIRHTEIEESFTNICREHSEVELCHDVKSLVMDENNIILMAEVEVREEALINNIQSDIEHVKANIAENINLRDERSAVFATVRRIDHIVEDLSKQLQQKHPQVQSVTIEVGIYQS